MSKIISIHSFRGGTGKSSTVANVSAAIANYGLRVGVVDTDIQSPGIHVLFGADPNTFKKTLNDYLWEKCTVQEATYDVTPASLAAKGGRIYLIPSSMKVGEISRIIRDGYDVTKLTNGFYKLIETLQLDFLMIDTHPGINEETLLSITVSDILIIVLRPDQQDFQGTAVTVDVARKLGVPKMLLLVNRAPSRFDPKDIREQVEAIYHTKVAGVMPNSEDVMELASRELFYLRYPEHPVSREIQAVANQLCDRVPVESNPLKKLFGR